MSLSTFILALFVFLQSAVLLGWFSVDSKLIGFVGIAFVVVLVLESLGTLSWSIPLHRRHA
jgi:hypothetical protein